jgi:hypothetical protein
MLQRAISDFLTILLDRGETWIIAYGFTLPGMIHEHKARK